MFRSSSNKKKNKLFKKKKKIDVDSLKEDQKELIKNNKLVLKTQQRLKSERHVFTQEINKIALISNDDKKMHSSDSIETYAHGTSKDLICRKEKMKHYNIIKQYKNA